MATVYASKIDGWLAAVLVLSMAISAWASVQVIVAGSAVAWWIVSLTAGAGVGLPLWILSSTNYTIAPTHLRIKSAPVPVANPHRGHYRHHPHLESAFQPGAVT